MQVRQGRRTAGPSGFDVWRGASLKTTVGQKSNAIASPGSHGRVRGDTSFDCWTPHAGPLSRSSALLAGRPPSRGCPERPPTIPAAIISYAARRQPASGTYHSSRRDTGPRLASRTTSIAGWRSRCRQNSRRQVHSNRRRRECRVADCCSPEKLSRRRRSFQYGWSRRRRLQ